MHNFDFQCLELLTHLCFISFQLVEQDSEGQCNSECKTIERACQEVRFPSLLTESCEWYIDFMQLYSGKEVFFFFFFELIKYLEYEQNWRFSISFSISID